MSKRKAEILGGMTDCYGKTMSEYGVRAYLAGISNLTDQEFEVAATRAIRSKKFFPSVAEIMEIARPQQDLEQLAQREWETFLVAVKLQKPSAVSDTAKAIGAEAAISFYTVEQASQEELRWLRRDFVTAFTRFATKPRSELERLQEQGVSAAGKMLEATHGAAQGLIGGPNGQP